MSAFKDSFGVGTSLTRGCSCGQHASVAAHDADFALKTSDSETPGIRVVEAAVMCALR